MKLVTAVKFKVKERCEAEFVKQYSESDCADAIYCRLVSIGENEYLSISEYFEVEKVLEAEESGVSWLDTVEHLLEFYGDSRTDAVSGHVVFELTP
jgi:DNA-binding ferritin-like protein